MYSAALIGNFLNHCVIMYLKNLRVKTVGLSRLVVGKEDTILLVAVTL